MQADRNKGQALCYLDQKFAYKNGKHNVENLILIGWLLCKHWNDQSQTTELWHILNPTLQEFVSKRAVVEAVSKLCYVAIDLNATMVESMPNSSEKTAALKYHARIKQNKKSFIEQLMNQLSPEVSRDELTMLMEIFRSYDLRMIISGDKESAVGTA